MCFLCGYHSTFYCIIVIRIRLWFDFEAMRTEGRRSRFFSFLPTIFIMKVAFSFALGLAATKGGFTPTTSSRRQRRLPSSSCVSSMKTILKGNSQRQFSVLPLYQSSDASTPTPPVNNTTSTSTTALEAVGAKEVASNTNDENPDSLKNMLKFAIPALGIYLSNPMLSNIDNGK